MNSNIEFKITMKKYRVEAFIIPSNCKNKNETNQIDDEKLAVKLKDKSLNSSDDFELKRPVEEEESNSYNFNEKIKKDEESSTEFSDLFFDINEHIYDEIIIPNKKDSKEVPIKKETSEYVKTCFKVEEPIYDEPFISNFSRVNKKENNSGESQSQWTLGNSKYQRFGIVAPKLPKRSSSLKSIVEDNESMDDTLQEVCCHGRKNGCLSHNQRPEDISEEIFKENWMQRLDALRKLETLLKDKEIALQSRERLLFKKEKELRILERLVKDKMKQADLYAKRHKKSLSSESISKSDRNVESRSSNDSKDHAKSESASSLTSLPFKISSKISLESKDERVNQNPPNSRTSSTTDRLTSRLGSVKSRSKHRQKIRYEDLDSTLSADIGDSSFIVTSKKFDPETFKKPAAFARSASERRPRIESQATLRLNTISEKDKNIMNNEMGEKVLKKFSENIIASQNQESKFLNYGLIDEKSEITLRNTNKSDVSHQKRFSYLNLELITKTIKPNVSLKERPVSWSEDTDDWLKKKREAYNLAKNKKININTIEKENFDRQTKLNKSSKITKKKENSQRKFSIFR